MADNVTLRELRAADLPVLYEHQRDPVACHMTAFSSRERDAFMVHWGKIMVDPATHLRAVLLDGTLVGNVSCFEREGLREVGYWIAREHWGKGIASRALALFLDVVSERPLYAFVVGDNTGSMRVLERNGFRELRREKVYIETRGAEVEDVVFVLSDGANP